MVTMDHLMPIHARRTSHTVRVPSLPARVALQPLSLPHCHHCNCQHCLHRQCDCDCDQDHLADSRSLLDRAAVGDELCDLPVDPDFFPIIAQTLKFITCVLSRGRSVGGRRTFGRKRDPGGNKWSFGQNNLVKFETLFVQSHLFAHWGTLPTPSPAGGY